MKNPKMLEKSNFLIEQLKHPKKVSKIETTPQSEYVICTLKSPSKIHIKYKKNKTNKSKLTNYVGSQTKKCVIFCPEEKVKQYAELVKNSQMSPVAVKPKLEKKNKKKLVKS